MGCGPAAIFTVMKSCQSLKVFVSNVLTGPVQAVQAVAVTEREQAVIDYIIAMNVTLQLIRCVIIFNHNLYKHYDLQYIY